jgi:hypothetical protein
MFDILSFERLKSVVSARFVSMMLVDGHRMRANCLDFCVISSNDTHTHTHVTGETRVVSLSRSYTMNICRDVCMSSHVWRWQCWIFIGSYTSDCRVTSMINEDNRRNNINCILLVVYQALKSLVEHRSSDDNNDIIVVVVRAVRNGRVTTIKSMSININKSLPNNLPIRVCSLIARRRTATNCFVKHSHSIDACIRLTYRWFWIC